METQVFSEFGIIGGSFIVMLISVLFYIPKAFKAHFELVAKITDKFSADLNTITDKNFLMAEGFVNQLNAMTNEHGIQNSKLEAIHNDIKVLIK